MSREPPSASYARAVSHAAASSQSDQDTSGRVSRNYALRETREEFVSQALDRAAPLVERAASEGGTSVHLSFDSGRVPCGGVRLLGERLRSLGYRFEILPASLTDYGDSAAPCLVEHVNLEISW